MKRKSAARAKTLSTAGRTVRTRTTRAAGARISDTPHERAFREVLTLIEQARQRAFQAVNTELIDLYWRVGEYISRKRQIHGCLFERAILNPPKVSALLTQLHPDATNVFKERPSIGVLLCATKDNEV